jgi:F-type H+-transporting ATPase subunit b
VEIINSIQWGTALYMLFVFGILLILLRKYAVGPLLGVMEERQQKIANDVATAEKNRRDAEGLIAEQKAALEAAKKDATQVLENARVTSEKSASELIKAAKDEAENIKRLARDEITREKEQAVAALRKEVGALSVMLAKKVIEKEIDEKQQEKLVADYLKEVGTTK